MALFILLELLFATRLEAPMVAVALLAIASMATLVARLTTALRRREAGDGRCWSNGDAP